MSANKENSGKRDTINQKVDPNKTMIAKKNVVKQFVLGKTIGEGTFGKVKIGTHILTGEKVAVKILEKSKIREVADVERVAREIHILKLLRHPNIIQLQEIIEDNDKLFLFIEYASGGELFDQIVKNQRLKEKEACKFFQQIINGIEYIHRLHVVHRDLKPENLLLDDNKNLKIVDFGLSNTYKSGELLKTACGSPCYAAPEMVAGKKQQGVQVDIWSSGVILFAMVCGQLPFEDPNTAALYKKILSGDQSCPKQISIESKDLIKNILNIDPSKRQGIKEIRAHVWYNIVREVKVEGVIVGFNSVPIDPKILESLDDFGFNRDQARKCLEANKHNHITTTYYLSLVKRIKAGHKSPCDPQGENQDPSLITPRPPNNIVNAILSNANPDNLRKMPKIEANNAQRDNKPRKYKDYKELSNLNNTQLINERLPELKAKTNNYQNFNAQTSGGTERKKDLNASFNSAQPSAPGGQSRTQRVHTAGTARSNKLNQTQGNNAIDSSRKPDKTSPRPPSENKRVYNPRKQGNPND